MTEDGSAFSGTCFGFLACSASACCSRTVTLCLGACIFRHVRLRVVTFTGYLWKCQSGHDSALYIVCCTSLCALKAVTLTEGGGETWPLMTPAPNTGCLVCLSLPAEPALMEMLTLTVQGAAGNLLQGPDCTVTSVATSGMVSGEWPDVVGTQKQSALLTACSLSSKSVFY